MGYAQLIKSSIKTIWHHKTLFILGVIIYTMRSWAFWILSDLSEYANYVLISRWGVYFGSSSDFFTVPDTLPIPLINVPIVGVNNPSSEMLVFIGAVAIISIGIGITIWVMKRLAEGALIAGVDHTQRGRISGLRLWWDTARQRLKALVSIEIMLRTPYILLLVGAAAIPFIASILPNTPEISVVMWLVRLPMGLALIVLIIIEILHPLADRACMLHESIALSSIRSGWQMMRTKLGSVLIVGVITAAPYGLTSLITSLQPNGLVILGLSWLFGGVVIAFTSTLWTLAWKDWSAPSTAG